MPFALGPRQWECSKYTVYNIHLSFSGKQIFTRFYLVVDFFPPQMFLKKNFFSIFITGQCQKNLDPIHVHRCAVLEHKACLLRIRHTSLTGVNTPFSGWMWLKIIDTNAAGSPYFVQEAEESVTDYFCCRWSVCKQYGTWLLIHTSTEVQSFLLLSYTILWPHKNKKSRNMHSPIMNYDLMNTQSVYMVLVATGCLLI